MSNGPTLSIADRIRLVRGFWAVVRDPSNLDQILDLSDRIAEQEDAFDLVPQAIRDAADGLDAHRPMPALEELRRLPNGTVGREYARFLDDNGLTPEALRPLDDEGPLGMLRAHMRGAHDLWHVVTGWTPDLLGELGLEAFYLAQVRAPFPGIILAAGLLHTIWKERRHTFEVIDAVAEGWRQGENAKLLVGLPWAEYVAMPVFEMQRELGVAPARRRPELVIPLVGLPAAG